MPRILILPDLLAPSGEPSLLEGGFPAFRHAEGFGKVIRIDATPPVSAPEALFLALDEAEADIAPGVLAVSALGQDPPERSTHFQLDLLSLQSDSLQLAQPTPEEFAEIARLLPKLDRKLVKGLAGTPGGLVYEDWAEVHTVSPDEAAGKPWWEALPAGEADEILRRYIDDSVNLLSEQEFNRRREGEGQPPVNVLWPWGSGFRPVLPNLALRFGTQRILASGHRWRGLARLVRWQAEALPMRDRTEPFWSKILDSPATFVVLDAPGRLRTEGALEEAEWHLAKIAENLLQPLLAPTPEGIDPLLVLATSRDGRGLALELPERFPMAIPFQEETLEDRAVPSEALNRLVAAFLRRDA